MITAIIIDDEKSGRETLQFILEKHFSKRVTVVGTGESVADGVSLIENTRPQLVFLDIEMPNESGLALVKKFKKIDFEIVVTTAFKDYGIDAIKIGALDYLLKPIDIDELENTLNKVDDKLNFKSGEGVLQKFINQVGELTVSKHKIPLLISNNTTIFVEANSIIRCEADGNYTRVYLHEGRTELITRLIKEMEHALTDFNFFRVHKSHLININHIKSYLKTDDSICMSDGSVVPLSRNIKNDFFKKMNI